MRRLKSDKHDAHDEYLIYNIILCIYKSTTVRLMVACGRAKQNSSGWIEEKKKKTRLRRRVSLYEDVQISSVVPPPHKCSDPIRTVY